MKRIYESPEGGLHRQFGDVQDARQDRVASDEPQLIQPWKADVQAQHDSQHEPVQAHGTGNPLGCQRLLHQGSEIEFLQHGDHRQQSSVGSQILTVEVVGRGSVDSIGFGSRAFGALFLGRFLVILCLVCNHLGDLLGSVLRSANFAELLFYPNVSGVPKWFSSRLSSGRRLITCIAQVSVGDFNGDGKADLLILNGGLGGVSVLLGNGDGTFQSPVAALAGTVFDVVIGDFNGDGKTDLAHRTYLGGANVGVSILLGKGDGTFQQGVTYPIAGDGLVSGDFNGDGKPDLVLTVGNPDNTQSALILLGNGDGTFQIAKTYAAGKGNYSAVVGDWNSDSKPDLASVSGSANVTLLLGNGDGTFQSPTLVPIPNPT